MKYRQGNSKDISSFKSLALKSWGQFQSELTEENWKILESSLCSNKTYMDLLERSYSLVCEADNSGVIGMAFLVPKGNPTDIYQKEWCYLRFVTVDPDFSDQGIGRKLTEKCIEYAKQNNEHTIALHTSEMMHKARHIYESLGFKILKEINPRFGKHYWLYTLDI